MSTMVGLSLGIVTAYLLGLGTLLLLSGFVSGRYQLHTLIIHAFTQSAGFAKDKNRTAPNEAYDAGVHYHCRSAMICRDDLEFLHFLLFYYNFFYF